MRAVDAALGVEPKRCPDLTNDVRHSGFEPRAHQGTATDPCVSTKKRVGQTSPAREWRGCNSPGGSSDALFGGGVIDRKVVTRGGTVPLYGAISLVAAAP